MAVLVQLRILDLRPTQMSVGMIEVRHKRKSIAASAKHHHSDGPTHEPLPGVYGPHKRFYLIDHHHLARALHEEGVTHATCAVMLDMSAAPYTDTDDGGASFWAAMSARGWVYPYDHHGHGPHPYTDLPADVTGLKDDVFRSLAGAVEKGGGFHKTAVPFQEFMWANYLRGIIPDVVVDADFEAAVQSALRMLHSAHGETPTPVSLPGFVPALL